MSFPSFQFIVFYYFLRMESICEAMLNHILEVADTQNAPLEMAAKSEQIMSDIKLCIAL